MRAIDTNVLARYLLNDDPAQGEASRRIVESGVFVSLTVILELGWLLASRYGFPRGIVAEMLSGVIDLPAVTVLDRPALAWAIERYAQTGDLADLLHLIGAGPAERFSTFDAGIARAAGPTAPIAIETLA